MALCFDEGLRILPRVSCDAMKFKYIATLICLAAFLTGCSTAKVVSVKELSTPSITQPKTIYVADFELQTNIIKQSRGLISSMTHHEGAVGRAIEGHSADTTVLSKKLVDQMRDRIIHRLKKKGFQAVAFNVHTPLPTNGWLVRGTFTEVQEGNRLNRAVVGFGLGRTAIKVTTTTDNLSVEKDNPTYQMEIKAASQRGPGGAVTLPFSPLGIPIQFIFNGWDLKTNVKHTGDKIAKEVIKRIKKGNPPAKKQRDHSKENKS